LSGNQDFLKSLFEEVYWQYILLRYFYRTTFDVLCINILKLFLSLPHGAKDLCIQELLYRFHFLDQGREQKKYIEQLKKEYYAEKGK